MMYPFFMVTLYSLMEVLKRKHEVDPMGIKSLENYHDKLQMMMDIISFVLDKGLPICLTLFVITFWLLGLSAIQV